MTVQERLISQLAAWDKQQLPWKHLKYITPSDFKNPGMMSGFLLIMLDNIRWRATQLAGEEIEIIVTSDFRQGDTDSTHGETPCLGVDVRARTSRGRYYLVRAALEVGITRIGIYCDDLHVHFDVGDFFLPDKYPREVMWVRECNKGGAA